MKYDPAADHILALSSGGVPRHHLDIAVTTLLLLESGPNWALAYEGLRKGRYQIDVRFVESLLRVASKRSQWAIVRSAAFWHLPKETFRRHFFRFWRLRRRDLGWRWALGRTLHPFLMNNHPGEGPEYARIVWTLVQDSDESVALAGLSCTGYLGPALTLEQAKTLISLTRRKTMKAVAAKSNIGTLYKNFDSLRPEVKALFLHSRTVATLSVNHDPTDTEKWGAHSWCLMNMKRVLRRHHRRRFRSAIPTIRMTNAASRTR